MLIKKGIKCKICGNELFSYNRHDYKECSCGNCFVDGGFEYLRVGAHYIQDTKEIQKDISYGWKMYYNETIDQIIIINEKYKLICQDIFNMINYEYLKQITIPKNWICIDDEVEL